MPPHWQGLMWGIFPFGSSLLAQRDRYNLLEVGLKVVQDEAFYVEPRLPVATAKTARAN